MPPEPHADPAPRRPGSRTLVLRLACTVLVASPLVSYISTAISGGGGNAYLFFLLLVLAPIAGLVLIVNSVWCLVRYPSRTSFRASLMFMLIGLAGFLEAWIFLPKFRM